LLLCAAHASRPPPGLQGNVLQLARSNAGTLLRPPALQLQLLSVHQRTWLPLLSCSQVKMPDTMQICVQYSTGTLGSAAHHDNK
jgi:hypothetical protein